MDLQHKKRVLALGSINADLVVAAKRAPRAGETIAGDSFQTFSGGKGANQAVAAALLLPEEVDFVGVLGTDVFAPMLRESLERAGVNISGMRAVEGPTGVALIVVEEAGHNRIVVVPGANAQLTAVFVSEQMARFQDAAVVLLQLESPLDAVTTAAKLASDAGACVILDPAPAQPLPASLLQHVTWLTPNYAEACVLTGREETDNPKSDTEALVDSLLRLGAKHVVLKLGEFGAVIAMSSGERHTVSAFDVDAIDTTAAGDAFNGGFAVAIAEGRAPQDAARWASAVAAIAVTRWGAQTAMPTRAEVERFLQQQADRRTSSSSDSSEVQTCA